MAVDLITQSIDYKGTNYPISRKSPEADRTYRGKKILGEKTSGSIYVDDAWEQMPEIKDALKKKTGQMQVPQKRMEDVSYGLVFEELQRQINKHKKLKTVRSKYKDNREKEIVGSDSMTNFYRILKALERDVDHAKDRPKGASLQLERGQIDADSTEQEIYQDEFYKKPIIRDWIDRRLTRGTTGKPDKAERKTSPPALWKFLQISNLATPEDLYEMTPDELIGEDKISGSLGEWRKKYRVNTIIKNITNNQFGLFETKAREKSQIKDLPINTNLPSFKVEWITPQDVEYKPKGWKKGDDKVKYTAKEFIDKIETEYQGTMGRTSWYNVAKAIRGFTKADYGSLPSESPLAQTVKEWAGHYKDKHLKGDLTEGQIRKFADCLRDKNHDAYFFFLLALELGMRKKEAFTLTANPPKSAERGSGVQLNTTFTTKDETFYDIQIITWKTRWIGVYTHLEICASQEVNKLIKERLDEIAKGEKIDKSSDIHSLVGEDNKYYPVHFLESEDPKQKAKQKENMDKLYADIKQCFLDIGETDPYFQEHPFHAFRHIFAQYQLAISDWDYASVAEMGHWSTLNVLKDSYGKKPRDTSFAEKIERQRLGMKNPIKETAERITKEVIKTKEQKEQVAEIESQTEREEYKNMAWVKANAIEFFNMVNDGTIDEKLLPVSQQSYLAKIRNNEIKIKTESNEDDKDE